MKRISSIFPLFLLSLVCTPLQAHFIWIIPDSSEKTRVKVVFSEGLEEDDVVPIEKIAGTKLFVRDADGKTANLDWKKDERAYLVQSPEKSQAVGGVCQYGVIQRGEKKPFLLIYYPKYIPGKPEAAKPWEKLPLEIVVRGSDKFQVLYEGKPVADAEVTVRRTKAKADETVKTDGEGEFKIRMEADLWALRVRHVEQKAGENEGKKYEEIYRYATLVFRSTSVPDPKSSGSQTALPGFAPLPHAVSSLGADVADGWLYVYGGHCARTHEYSTEAVSGAFHRLKLTDPTKWEELPSGPALQGLALVTHGGKLYRVGGMQPRNKPGEKTDNHSVANCSRYDPATGKWEDLPDLPAARSSHDAVVVGNTLVVVGGWSLNGRGKASEWHSTTLLLDLDQRPMKWRSIEQPFQRRALTACVHQRKVHVIGGMAEDGGTELTLNIYDPEKKAWTKGPNLPGPDRNGFSPAACVLGGRMFVSLGDGRVVVLTDKGTDWEEVGKLKQPRIVHRLVPADSTRLLAVGGASKGECIALTEVVAP